MRREVVGGGGELGTRCSAICFRVIITQGWRGHHQFESLEATNQGTDAKSVNGKDVGVTCSNRIVLLLVEAFVRTLQLPVSGSHEHSVVRHPDSTWTRILTTPPACTVQIHHSFRCYGMA